jgi:hypothetical protein
MQTYTGRHYVAQKYPDYLILQTVSRYAAKELPEGKILQTQSRYAAQKIQKVLQIERSMRLKKIQYTYIPFSPVRDDLLVANVLLLIS